MSRSQEWRVSKFVAMESGINFLKLEGPRHLVVQDVIPDGKQTEERRSSAPARWSIAACKDYGSLPNWSSCLWRTPASQMIQGFKSALAFNKNVSCFRENSVTEAPRVFLAACSCKWLAVEFYPIWTKLQEDTNPKGGGESIYSRMVLLFCLC